MRKHRTGCIYNNIYIYYIGRFFWTRHVWSLLCASRSWLGPAGPKRTAEVSCHTVRYWCFTSSTQFNHPQPFRTWGRFEQFSKWRVCCTQGCLCMSGPSRLHLYRSKTKRMPPKVGGTEWAPCLGNPSSSYESSQSPFTQSPRTSYDFFWAISSM